MADETTYRPEKRPIQPSEIEASISVDSEEVSETQANLDDMSAMRAKLADEAGREPAAFDPTEPGAFAISGAPQNIPDGFAKAMENKKKGEAVREARQEGKQMKRPQTNPMGIRVTGSDRLEELIAGIQSTSVSFEEILLPSKGRFYNGENGPVNGVLHIRPMTGEEEQILATSRYVRSGQAIDMIFKNCISENYDTHNLLSQDRTYILIYLRGISYSVEYDVELRCPMCERNFDTTLDLDALEIDYCPDDLNTDLTDVLPTTKYKFSYRLRVGADEKKVQDYKDRRRRGFDLANAPDDTLLLRSAFLINDIEGLTDTFEILELMKKLPINDVAYLRNTVNDPPFGVNTNTDVMCDTCFHEFEVDLPLEVNFFFPQTKKK